MARSVEPDARVGAATLAGAGIVWGLGAVAYGDWIEAPKCFALGIGFALAAWGVHGGRRGLAAAGLVLAALPATAWMSDALAHGHPFSSWVVLGAGVDLAALLLLAAWRVAAGPPILLRAAFALVAAGGAIMLVRDPSLTVWTLAPLLALAGGLLLTLRPPFLAEGPAGAPGA